MSPAPTTGQCSLTSLRAYSTIRAGWTKLQNTKGTKSVLQCMAKFTIVGVRRVTSCTCIFFRRSTFSIKPLDEANLNVVERFVYTKLSPCLWRLRLLTMFLCFAFSAGCVVFAEQGFKPSTGPFHIFRETQNAGRASKLCFRVFGSVYNFSFEDDCEGVQQPERSILSTTPTPSNRTHPDNDTACGQLRCPANYFMHDYFHRASFLGQEVKSMNVGLTSHSVMLSVDTSLATVLVFTWDLMIIVNVVIDMIFVVCVLYAFMFYAIGYGFGVIETIGATIFIGMSVDCYLNLARGYQVGFGVDRRTKVESVLTQLGPSIMGVALTRPIIAVFPLLWQTLLFVELGAMLFANVYICVFFAFLFLAPLLMVAGPLLDQGKSSRYTCRHLFSSFQPCSSEQARLLVNTQDVQDQVGNAVIDRNLRDALAILQGHVIARELGVLSIEVPKLWELYEAAHAACNAESSVDLLLVRRIIQRVEATETSQTQIAFEAQGGRIQHSAHADQHVVKSCSGSCGTVEGAHTRSNDDATTMDRFETSPPQLTISRAPASRVESDDVLQKCKGGKGGFICRRDDDYHSGEVHSDCKSGGNTTTEGRSRDCAMNECDGLYNDVEADSGFADAELAEVAVGPSCDRLQLKRMGSGDASREKRRKNSVRDRGQETLVSDDREITGVRGQRFSRANVFFEGDFALSGRQGRRLRCYRRRWRERSDGGGADVLENNGITESRITVRARIRNDVQVLRPPPPLRQSGMQGQKLRPFRCLMMSDSEEGDGVSFGGAVQSNPGMSCGSGGSVGGGGDGHCGSHKDRSLCSGNGFSGCTTSVALSPSLSSNSPDSRTVEERARIRNDVHVLLSPPPLRDSGLDGQKPRPFRCLMMSDSEEEDGVSFGGGVQSNTGMSCGSGGSVRGGGNGGYGCHKGRSRCSGNGFSGCTTGVTPSTSLDSNPPGSRAEEDRVALAPRCRRHP
eukprot:TRINITY_DN15627_c0_g2_i4.p1 TRINITY_DN15627_c0_g2~~TRINITY_DN15627_c0_g2_i4.p1  ORF type:complete len:1108 (-),score=154.84 TRINITY_DN15627_c0_g2_i4:464-3346(-)